MIMHRKANDRVRNRKPTSIDVAREAGVSQTTVSLILNGIRDASFPPETIKRVREAAQRLQYRPNVAARSVSSRKAYALGLISRWVTSSPFFSRPVQGMLRVAQEAGYALTLCDVEAEAKNAEATVDRVVGYYREGRIDGVIAILATLEKIGIPASVLHRCIDENIPIVLVNAYGNNPMIDEIRSDNFHAGYLGTRHLLQLGHRRIAFFLERKKGDRTTTAASERLMGYRHALREAKIDPSNELVIRIDDAPVIIDTGYNSFKEYLRSCKSPPSALYAINDNLALGAMYAALDHGLRVPDDLAIVGTDDCDFSRDVRPRLTSVRQPLELMGEESVRLLLKRLNHEGPSEAVKQLFKCELVIRESCGAKNLRGRTEHPINAV